MIHVPRTHPQDIIASLEEEAELAIDYFEGRPPLPGRRVFREFEAYKSEIVKAELKRLFANKCAYCEFPIVGHPDEVEHYRPKGAFRMENGKLSDRGYYWLGARWDNLLLSCMDCNRERYQTRDPSDPMFPQRPRQKAGKQSLFPLADPAKRWRDRTLPNEEEPLLLDPCSDEAAEQHIDFTDDGIPIPGTTMAGPSARGNATIEINGLWRDALVRERREVLRFLEEQLFEVIRDIRRLKASPNGGLRREFAEDLARHLDQLERFKDPGRKFIAMGRRVIADFEVLRPRGEFYLDLRARFNADPSDPNLEAQLASLVVELKRFAESDQGRSRLRKRLVEYFTGESWP